MSKFFRFSILRLSLIATFFSLKLHAVGTKQLSPNSTDIVSMVVNSTTGIGSYSGAAQEDRIYFHISDAATENFYFGFDVRATTNSTSRPTNSWYTIKNSAGTIVSGPTNILNSGTGFPSNYTQAFNGVNIAGTNPSGFVPYSFDPSSAGDYYIEIYTGTSATNSTPAATALYIPYFDMEVATSAGVIRPGRIYSEKWSLRATAASGGVVSQGNFPDRMSSALYAYTDDQTVVRIEYEGFKPLQFGPAFNKYGVASNGPNATNWLLNRASVNSGATGPVLAGGYKVFLTQPDTAVFQITTTTQPVTGPIQGCPGAYTIPYTIAAAGDVKILLDLNGTVGFQASTSDRILELLDVPAGSGQFAWDGLDGLGNVVPPGNSYNISLSLLRGRVNSPSYDAEINTNGFNITSILPTPNSNLKVFWDDSTGLRATNGVVSGGVLQFTLGSNASGSLNPGGTAASATHNLTGRGAYNALIGQTGLTHAYDGTYGSGSSPTLISPPPAFIPILTAPVDNFDGDETPSDAVDDFGNLRTINSWFWAVEETANLSALVVPGCYPISGTLFSDANGLSDGTVNGTGSDLGGSFAVLVDDSGKVVATTPIAANGTYTFNNIETGNYSVQVNTTAPTVGSTAPAVQLPAGFTASGENIGSGAGSDGTPNGILPVVLAFTPISNANLAAIPKDTDGDGVPDSSDLDDDNDGILDTVEGVCTNSTLSSINTPNYPLTTPLQNTSLPLVGLGAGGVMSFNATLSGSGTWGNGVQIRNDFPGVNDYIYLQPTNVASGVGAATYEINFAYPLTNVVFTAGGLNNNDQHIITAFNGTTPLTIDPSNFSGFSPALPAQWTVSGNSVSNATSAGGTDVTTNLFTTTIPGPVTRIVIVSSKSTNNTGTVTTSLQGFQFCPDLDFDNDGIPNSEDLDSDNDGCSDANEYYNSATADGGSGQFGPGPDPAAVALDGKVTAASYVGTYLLDSTVATACGKPAPNPDVNQTWVNVPVTGDVSTNDEVPAGSTYSNPPANPSNPGTAVPTINSDGTYTFTSPVPGVFTFKVPVTYPNGDIDSVDLVITVLDDTDPNVKPVANVDLATTPLNTPVSLNTLGNDVATNPSNPLVPGSITVTDAPSNGTTSVDAVTGNITYTPNPGFSGKDTLTYTVTDANGNTVTAQQIITILPAGAPNTTTATDDYKSAPFNTPVSGNAISNDQDAEGDVQAIVPQVTTIAGKGTLTLNSDGTYTFVPVSGFSGPVEFPYSIYDNDANPDSATATIHILIAPPVPAPNPDVNQTWVNVPVTGDVSTNDEVPAGSTYGNSPANPSNPGTAVPTINSDGTYTFTSPVPGVFTFKVPVTYPNGDIDSVDLVITVLDDTDPNVKPVANVDLATTPLNTPVSLNTLGNDVATNPSNPLVPASVTVTDAPSNGTTSVDAVTGNITYTPNPGFSGKDTLTYTVTDANGNTVTAQQIITILPAGAPNTTTATDDYKSAPFNTPVSGNAISNDQDAEGDVQAIVPQVTTIAGKGTLTLNSDGTYTFVPVSGFSGPVEFPYSIYDNDANPDSATATIHILIAPPVPAPNPDVNQTWVNVPVTGDVSTNDEVPAGSTYGNPPANPSNPGTAVPTINSDGTYTFTSPVPGVFTFKVPVTYPNGDIDSVDLVITVLDDADPNVKPVANVDLATTPLNTPVSLNTLGNDVATNPSNPLVPGSVTVTDAPSNGTTSVDAVTGNITYTPNPGFSGKDTLTYTVTDANGNTVTAQQIITILPAGAPNTTTATDDYKSGPFNTPVSGNAISNDQDAEGDVQAIVPQVTTIAGKGTLTLNSDGTYTFVPVSGFSGPVEFPYSIYDNDANPDSATATIHILIAPPISVTGTVFNDVNGLNGSPSNTIDGVGTNAGGLFANLLDGAGNVVASVPVAANGTYTFANVAPGNNYSVQVNGTAGTVGAAAPAVTLPGGYVSTGENNGAGPGSDGSVNGVSAAFNIIGASITNINFGIELPPTAGINSQPAVLNPTGTIDYAIANTLFTGTDADGGVIDSIRITSFPANVDEITINGTVYTSATFPVGGVSTPSNASGNPITPILIDPIDGTVTVNIPFVTIDNAGKESPIAGSASVQFLQPVGISGTVINDKDKSATGNNTSIPTGSEVGTNTGSPLYVYLVDPATGLITAQDTVDASGNYAFGGIAPNTDVKLVLSTTPAANGALAPASVLPTGWDATSKLDTTFNVGAPIPAIISSLNFGLNYNPNVNPDVNQTWVNVPVTGDVSSNDENLPAGSTYSNPAPNPGNPGTAVPTINPDGTYSFTSPVAGVFTFKVPAISPNGDTVLVDLVITVLDDKDPNVKPVANVDLATTPLNTPVSLNTLGNDVATNPNNPLVPGSVTVTDAPSNGTTSVDAVTGNITYTPNPGFSGKDTLTYAVTDANGNTVTAQQIITILPAGAPNTTTATDDYKSGPYNTPVSGNAITNDQDAEGDVQAIVPQVTTIAGKGTLTLNSDGTYTFVPVSGFSGPVEFPYSIYDNDANPDSATATIHILIAPPVPAPAPDVNQTWVNVPVTGDVSTNDEVPAGSTYGNPPANPSNPGTAIPTINSDGTYTFTSPVPGVFTFKVPVTYPNGDIDSVDLVITVLDDTDPNVKPVANVDLATTPLNTPVSLNTLGNDVATNPSNPLVPASVTVTDAPSNGTTSVDAVTGNITYTPNLGFSGKDTLTYTVTDANGNTVTAQQIITILPAGAPNTTTATDDYKSGPYNTPVSGNAISNDQDAEGDVQAIVPQVTTIAGKGTLTLNSDGTYTFVPVSGFSGPVEFPYSIYDNDANPDSATATIHILIAPPVPAPAPDVNQTWVNVPVTGDVSTNDEVPAGSTYGNPPANPSNPGTAVPTINSDGTYTFTSPVPGVFTFKVPVTYPNGDIDSVDLVITVLDDADPNVKPVANVDLATTPLNTPVSLNTLGNDVATNPSNPLVPSSVTVTDAPSNGTTSVDTVTGNITYTPNPGFSGKDTLTYTVTDANGNTVTAQQIITILPAGAPNTTTATDDYKSGPFNTPVSGNAISNDQDAEGDVQAIVPQVTTIAGKGTLTLNSDGTYTFVPVSGFSGPVEFPYSIYDNDANPDSATATIHILIAPPVPAPTPDVNQTWVNVPVTGDVSTNDEVPAGSTYGNPPANPSNPGTAVPTINSDGTYTFTSPVPGVFTFKVPVTYPNGDIDSVDLVITVLDDTDPNVKPVANVDLATTPLNTAVSLNTLGNDVATNPSNPLVPASVTVTDAPSNGTTSVDAVTGNITYTPNPGFSGKDTLTYTVTDANGNTVTAQQIITILPAGAPNTTTATDDYKSAPFNTPVSGNAITNDQDAEGDVQAIVPQVTTIAGKGTLTLNSDGTYTFVPVSGFSGPVEFPYSIYDNDANPDSATATIHILIAPPVPAPAPDVNQTWVNVPVTGDVSTNDEVPAGSTYGNPPANPSNPGTAVPTINSDGTYTFTSPVPGVFTFKVPVTYPNGDIDSVDLVITVLDDADPNVKPVANVDLATTPLNTAVSLNTLGNDVATNPNNPLVPASVTVTDAPSNGTTSVDAVTGNITYTPNPGFSGKDTLTYTVTDANGNTVTAQQIITILPAGAPNTTTATDDYKSGPFNTPVSGNAISNDQDAEGDVQAIVPQVTTIAGKGTLTLNSDGTYTFVPVSGFSGPVEFPYSIYDNDANPDSATATIHILIAPPVPAPNPDVNQTWVNVPVTGDVSTNDEVPAGSTYGNPPANPSNPGTAVPTINSDGTYTFTSPVPGVFTFKVPVTYPNGDIDSVDLVITVLDDADPNVKPVANVDLATTPLNTPVSLNTLGNDVATNPSNPLVPASVTVTDAPSNGTTSVDAVTGNITYTPNPGFSGKDTLTYTVTDANGNTVTAQQIITILPAGAPNTTTATDDYKSGPYNTPVSGNAISNDQDAEGDVQAIVPQVTTIAGKGTLTLNSDGTYTFVPVSGFSGPVEFPYSIYDNDANPDSATATIHILIAPPVPAPNPDVNVTWAQVPVTGDVSTNDVVPAGSTYGNPPANPSNPGTAVPTINSDGTYTFTSPIPGVFTFKVPVVYPNGNIDSVDLVITVLDSASNTNPPAANTDIASTPINIPVTLVTLSNDYTTNTGTGVGLNPALVTVIENPSNGTTIVDPVTGDITYFPNAGFVGKDTLKYSVTDSLGNIVEAYQIITIIDTAVAPNSTTASDDYTAVTTTAPVLGNALGNDTDPEGDSQTVTPFTTTIPGKGTLVLAADGSFTFTPVPGFVGPVAFPYTATDARGATADATIYVLVDATSAPFSIFDLTLVGKVGNGANYLSADVNTAAEIATYKLYRKSKESNVFELIATVNGGNDFEYSDYAVTSAFNAYYVEAIGINNVIVRSNTVNLSTVLLDQVVISPNPASSNVAIRFNAAVEGVAKVSITDMTGKVVMIVNASVDLGFNAVSIDVNSLPAGNYTIQLSRPDQEVSSFRFQKN